MTQKHLASKYKKLYLSLLFALLPVLDPVQLHAQSFQWVRQYGTNRVEQGNGVAIAEGNLYVAGDTIGVLPGQTNTNLNDRDAFVSRFDTLGNLTWTRQFGASPAAEDVANAVAADGSGVYVVGTTRGTLPQQSSVGGFDVFIRKYDANGLELWTRQFGTLATDEGLAVAANASGVYVVGVVDCCAASLIPGQPSFGSSDAFIRKYDGNGNVQWTRQFGTGDRDIAMGVAVDATGVYVTGETGGALGPPPLGGLRDGFLRRYDLDGTHVWTRQFGSSQNEESHAVAVGPAGIYVGGRTTGTVGSQSRIGGVWDAYVMLYNTSGAIQWTRQFGTTGDGDDVLSLAASGDLLLVGGGAGGALPGQTYVGGQDAFIRLYNDAGTELGTRQFGNGGNDFAAGATADLSGFYVAGGKNGNSLNLTPIGDIDIFVMKVQPPPTVPDRGVVNGASFATNSANLPAPPLAPGSIAVIFGSYLNDGSNTLTTSFGPDGKLVTTLAGTQVRVNDVLAPLFYSTPGQVAIQIPFEVAGQTTASLVVTVDGQSSTTRTINIAPTAPGFFTLNQAGTGAGVALHADGVTPVSADNPARPNEVIVFYLTGLGALSSPLESGAPAGGNPAAAAATLTLGGIAGSGLSAVIDYAGAAPGFVGLNQVNARIPANTPTGNAVAVALSIGGRLSNQVTLAIGP